MRILFFIDSLGSGGKERRFIELLKGISQFPEIKFEIAVMSEIDHYKEIHSFNTSIHFLIRKTRKDISVFSKFYKLCKNFKPDIVHCWDSMTAIYCIPACKLLSIPLVNGMIADSPNHQNFFNKYKWRAKFAFKFSDIILANSKAGLLAYDAPKLKSLFIHNGFNFKRNHNLSDKDTVRKQLKINTKFVIGMVASFSKFKDYATYFKAAQLLLEKRDDVTFVAVGHSTDSVASSSLIARPHAQNFRLLGEQTNIESIINVFDIGVLITFTEGISNSIMEYMALGKPVIATDGGGTPEIVEDKKTGFLIKLSDVNDLIQKIEILLADEHLRNQMGEAGRRKILTSFSIDDMVEKYIAVYQGIFESKNLKKVSVPESLKRNQLALKQ